MEEDNDLEQVTGSPTAGENGFVHIESADSAPTDGGSINQVDHLEQDDGVVITGVDTVQYERHDARTTEDGGHDEFVDCPDDLVSNDVRSPVGGNRASQQPFGNDMEDIQYRAPDDEKEIFPQDYEQERRMLMKEVTNLHHQLKALSKQQLLIGGIDAGFSSDQLTSETGEGGEKALLPLHEMVNECFKLIELALNERSQAEGTIRELNATLHMKDKEIEDLMARLNEHSISQDVVAKSDEVSSVEATADRILFSLATALGDAELSDTSVSGKVSHLEKSTSLLLEKYHYFLSEVEMLSHCLSEVKSDFYMQNDMETVFLSVREELFALKRKELELANKNSHLEYQHGQLMEQLNKGRETVELLNAEIGKLKGEVEQERTRYTNTKEKLSLAVTKGKALVQQRDSLKQLVAEKTSELERRLIELQEKSSALEHAGLRNDELTRTENLVNSLQEALSQRDMILQKCGEILSLSGAAGELQPSDIIERVAWLANEVSRLAPLSWEFQRLTELLSSLELPEARQPPNLESQVSWLLESYNLGKNHYIKLQHQNDATREAAHAQIDRLTASLLAEALEKHFFIEEFEDLKYKYEGIVGEKKQMVALLLDASGFSIDGFEENFNLQSDMAVVIGRCFSKIKEQAITSTDSSSMDKEVLEKIQNLLYVRDQESKLYEQILEEEKMYRLERDNRSNELVKVFEELRASKDEKNSLQINLQRAEEKASLLREKLSLAVKKGKGLVQERESMKQLMAEKNAQIEALMLDSQKQESTLSECRDQINILSTEVKKIAKLESDLLRSKEERDQIEQFLVQSNTLLQQVIETIDGIILPVDLKEPVEKVKWLATYLSECQVAKAQAEQELGDVKDEAGMLASKLTEALATIKSLEDALSVSEKNVSQLAEEKRELEFSKTCMGEELQKAIDEREVSKTQAEQEMQILKEEVSTLNKKLVEALKTLKSLEDSLSGSEKTISQLTEEKRELEIAKSRVEEELYKAMEEATSQSSKFQEASANKKSLEEALSLAKNNISVLLSEQEEAQASKAAAEMELQKVKLEVSAHAINLDEAHQTIKSLEDAMSQINTNVSQSSQENETLTSRNVLESEIKKLKEEAKYHERKVVDASATIKTLEDALLKVENTVFDLVGEKKNAELEISALNTELSTCRQELAAKHDKWASELSSFFGNLEVLLKDGSLLSLFKQSFERKIKSLKEIDRLLNEMKDNFDSEKLQDHPAIKENFQSTFLPADDNDWTTGMIDDEFNAKDIDGFGSYAGKTLDNLNTRNQILVDQFGSFSTVIDDMIASLLIKLEAIRNTVPFMVQQTKALQEKLKSMQLDMSTTIEELKGELEKSKSLNDIAEEENDALQRRVFELETELEASGNMCNEMSFKLEDYQAKEDKWKEREAELSVQSTRFQERVFKLETELKESVKDYEGDAPNALLSASQIKALFDKIDGIAIPFPNLVVGNIHPQDSDPVKKLFYIVDSVNELLDQMTLLSHAKEELRSTLSKQALEVEHLKGEFKEAMKDKQEAEKTGRVLFDLSIGLQSIIQKLGGDESVGVKKSADVAGLLPVLERLVQGIVLDSDNSRSKAQDLSAKLLETQKVAEELASKVKLLEDFIQNRTGAPNTIQEKSVFASPSLPSKSEISEIEDQVPVGKIGLPLVPSAPHVRSLRKNSSDQLAITIDSESDRLLGRKETVEDKGHVFKSLHTSGLVPVKGKMIADRLDGIWVSGGQALMRRPRARLSLIAYWLFIHLWLLGTIL
ncbi:hypothetical protein Ccrd_015952 [Cynara cardunculus var. scolymus]|uniref:Uncharacterized protein n=1 Tax=Cynara cardunculus var. scolymus TaxID=59895 RepID=A0A103YAY9_CYNCS|nr:hypothetical protein Ccrd_015952 [Cynara cardunculus var. scolymus]